MSGRVLLVTGASGQLGREVVARLVARGGGDRIVAGTREPSKLADLAARGVQIRRVDFDDEPGLLEAFRGVDRALIVSTDAVGLPGRRAEQHERAVRAAAAAGVGHLVYTSLANPAPDSPVAIAPDHRRTEAALVASGVGHTILRNNLYADFLPDTLRQAVATGQLVTARGDGAAAYVLRADCALAAAGALTDTFDGRRTLDVTGPEALTGDDLAAIAAEATGRTVVHVSVPAPAWVEGLEGAGVSRPLAELLVSFEQGIARGDFARIGDAVERLGGAAAASVRPFLAQALAG